MSPDITMCDNNECPLNKTCYRYQAYPNQHQSYAHFEPIDGQCEHYWEVEK